MRASEILKSGKTVTLEGVDWAYDDSPLQVGDWYIGQRDGDPKLGMVEDFWYWDAAAENKIRRSNEVEEENEHYRSEYDMKLPASMVNGGSKIYPFYLSECVKVKWVRVNDDIMRSGK